MIQIELQQAPNQNLKLRINEELYDITIKTTQYSTHISISRDDIVLVSSQILIPNSKIIRYDYLATDGNFVFETQSNNLPDYNKFNVSQFLYYLTNDELVQ